MEDPYPVENIDRLGDLMFQTSDKSQLLRRVLWINAQLTRVWSKLYLFYAYLFDKKEYLAVKKEFCHKTEVQKLNDSLIDLSSNAYILCHYDFCQNWGENRLFTFSHDYLPNKHYYFVPFQFHDYCTIWNLSVH